MRPLAVWLFLYSMCYHGTKRKVDAKAINLTTTPLRQRKGHFLRQGSRQQNLVLVDLDKENVDIAPKNRSNQIDFLQEEDEQLWERILLSSFDSIPAPTAPIPTEAPIAPPTKDTPTFATITPTAASSEKETPVTASCRNILWSDEFNDDDVSTLQGRSVWSYDIGRGPNEDGWGNLELQQYTSNEDNLRIENGLLYITALRDGDTFSSARIKTEDHLEVLYGTVEARIRLPRLNDGLWPAFWTLGGNFREVSWPQCGEIDILEMGSADGIKDDVTNRRVTSATHWEFEGTSASTSAFYDNPMDLAADDTFHIYRMEWTPKQVATYVDDNLVFAFDIAPDVCSDCSEFHQPHFLLSNLAVGGIFTGILEDSDITAPFPAEMAVDYLRICDNGETRLSGSAINALSQYSFDCGAPERCTASALNNYAGDASCGDHIQFLLDTGMSEAEACRLVAGSDYPAQCGVCDREECTSDVLDTSVNGPTCRDRIDFLVIRHGQSQAEACNQVAGVEFSSECGPCKALDCGLPDTCTNSVLATSVGGPTCRERIQFSIQAQGYSEAEACQQIAGVEFPEACAGCFNLDCENSEQCTDDVLNKDADGFTCRDCIHFLMTSNGLSEAEACQTTAAVEFPTQCGPCATKPNPAPLDCGVPETCTTDILATDAGGFSCIDRMQFLNTDEGKSEEEACRQVASEFLTKCSGCQPRLNCSQPESCTREVLATDVGGFACGARIQFLMQTQTMIAACTQVAVQEFPSECGGCAPPQ